MGQEKSILEDFSEEDKKFIKRCIEFSDESVKNGDAPFGALIVDGGGEIIAESGNGAAEKVSDHAEIIVMDKAHKKIGKSDLSECVLYSNCEPCPMCSFMAREYKLKKIVFAVHSLYMGGFSKYPILQDEELSRLKPFFGPEPEVVSGVLEDEALDVFKKVPAFWAFGYDARERDPEYNKKKNIEENEELSEEEKICLEKEAELIQKKSEGERVD